jgi:hypothetical protein
VEENGVMNAMKEMESQDCLRENAGFVMASWFALLITDLSY